MDSLPFVDRHTTCVAVDSQRTWEALTAHLRDRARRARRGPLRLVAAALGARLQPPQVAADQDVGGFRVRRIEAGEELALDGHHRFARYRITFRLSAHPGGTRLVMDTHAAFHGRLGRGYRAAVIGSGAHRVAVRRMLAGIKRRADRTRT